MDMEEILNSVCETEATEPETNSEVEGKPAEVTTEAPASEAPAEQEREVASDAKEASETESESTKEQPKAKKPVSKLDKAEFNVTKWKRKYKAMRQMKDKLEAEFNRYKDLNPRAFEDEEERMKFLAWKASTAQRLDDMNADLGAIEDSQRQEDYDAKVAKCYSPATVGAFRQLDDTYSDVFEKVCKVRDPDNVIMDFLRGSEYEPAMRNVIYKNGDLQEELLARYKNPHIASAKRLQILTRLEQQVKHFLTQPREQNQAPVTANRRFTLPPRQTRVVEPEVAPQSQVTGSITRGSETGAPDFYSQADELFKSLFGKA